MDNLLTDAVLANLAWDAFKENYQFYKEKVEDFVLRKYIKNKHNIPDNEIDIIETAILEAPQNIKDIEDPKEQEEKFKKYFIKQKNIIHKTVIKGDVKGVVHAHSGSIINQTIS